VRAILLAPALFACAVHAGAPERPKEPFGPPVQRLVWKAPQRIRCTLAMLPMWFSLGHTSRVLCLVPRGGKEENGQTILTRDGSGQAYALDFEVHEVQSFDPRTQLPAAVRRLTSHTIRADDPEALKRRRWPFPSEMGKDFELSLLPAKQHQALFRIFLHDKQQQFWHTLMVHTEADLGDLPPALAAKTGARKAFTELLCHIIVCELLSDPTLPMTSRYIEPDDPPSTWWIAKERVPAPWASGRQELMPAQGSLEMGPGDRVKFVALTEGAKAAARKLEAPAKAKGGPRMPSAIGGDAAGNIDPATEDREPR